MNAQYAAASSSPGDVSPGLVRPPGTESGSEVNDVAAYTHAGLPMGWVAEPADSAVPKGAVQRAVVRVRGIHDNAPFLLRCAPSQTGVRTARRCAVAISVTAAPTKAARVSEISFSRSVM